MCGNGIDQLTEIGGYFGLELPDYGDPFPNAHKFQSGRAALRAALESDGTRRVLLPEYVCDSVVKAAIDSGAVVEPYMLDDSLYPKKLPTPIPEDCAVLYVNYFGLCDSNVNRLIQEVNKKRLIIDNSQALFSPPENVMASIYSARKFIGVPDGGLLFSSDLEIKIPDDEDTESLARMEHILLRTSCSAREGYPSYIKSEEMFSNTKPLRMSRLTRRLLSSIDLDAVKKRRRENFKELALQLDEFNDFKWKVKGGTVPLCYPFLVGRNIDKLKDILIVKGIFIPTYWQEIKPRVSFDSIEYRISHCCLFVPCDQRYSTLQMDAIAKEIITGLEGMNGL